MTDIKQQGDLYIIDDANNTLTVDSANTRVGIGNNNPGHSLSVTGDGNFTANLSAGSNLFLVDAGNSRITLGTTTAVAGNVLTVVGNTDIAGTTNTTTLQLGGTTVTTTATELNQLSGLTLGTAASANIGDFATAAQGALADTALQTAAVDGTTITGDGTIGNPLIANIGGGNTLNDTYYRFETSTALTPASGKVQFDNATFSSVTEIAFNATNKNGVDIGVILNTFIDASYQVYFQQKDDASKAVLFNITSGATYDAVNDVYKFDVTHLQTTTQMSNGKDCFVLFAYREDSTNGTVTSVATTAPLTGGTITTTGTLGITQSGAGADGYLSSVDWNTFNNKQPAGVYLTTVAVDGVTITGDGTVGNPLVASGGGGGGVSIGDAVGGGTSGSILFVDASTNLAQDNSELFWDNTNNRLGIGTATPSAAIEVDAGAASEYAILSTGANGRVGLTTQYGGIHFNNVEATSDLWQVSERDTAQFDIAFGTPDAGNNVGAGSTILRITSGGNVGVGLGSTNPSTRLHVSGTIRQTNSTNAVLVSDGNGDIGSASNLQDIAYSDGLYVDGSGAYPLVPPAPSAWGGAPPATLNEAIDRLAAALYNISGPIP